jgi:branched-chain amino acid transport system substrate-binding protein
VLTTGGNANASQMKQFQSFLPKELMIAIPPATLYDDLPAGRLKQAVGVFNNAFKAAGMEPDTLLATAWDPALIIVSALRTLGTDAPPDKIRDYINNLRGWSGASGEYDFRDGSQMGLGPNTVMITRWDPAKGAFVAISRLGGLPR